MDQLTDFAVIERRLVVTARKIRMFKETMARQRELGVTNELLDSSLSMLQRMEQEYKKLAEALLSIPA